RKLPGAASRPRAGAAQTAPPATPAPQQLGHACRKSRPMSSGVHTPGNPADEAFYDPGAFLRSPRRVAAYIGMGANLGDTRATLEAATADIAALPQVHAPERSPFYRSAPVNAAGPECLNAVLEFDTPIEAEALLRALQAIDIRHGRSRRYLTAPRTLDLDLLLRGDEMRQSAFLSLPHPRMHLRGFVL